MLIYMATITLLMMLFSYFRVSLKISYAGVIIVSVITMKQNISTAPLAITILTIFTVLNIKFIRRHLISNFLYKIFQKNLPKISDTEKTAINAGNVWWESDLFSGSPDWKKFEDIQVTRLSPNEINFLNTEVEQLCSMLNEFTITHNYADMSKETWEFLKKNKFFAMVIPVKYGGLDFSAYCQNLVLQKIASISSVASSTVAVPNSLGPAELILKYGTESQKEHYLPRLASGKEIPCFGLTGIEAGSDATSIPDEGIICYDNWENKKTLGIKLNWNKRYITLAPIATIIGLAFKLKDPDKIYSNVVDLGINCAIIPTNLEGIKIGRRHFPLNCTFQNGPTQGENVFIPLENIIGGSKMIGKGWKMITECLSIGRAITLPANSTGSLLSLAVATGSYARIRRQFKLPIGAQEGIKEQLAFIGGNAYLMQAVSEITTTSVDLGYKPSIASAIAKYHLTHKLQQCVVKAMDVHGGKGICLGESNYIGRGYQFAPIAVTVEGANILTRCMIIFGQGAIRCHPFILKIMNSLELKDKKNGRNIFDDNLWKTIGFFFSNLIKSLVLGVTKGAMSYAPKSNITKKYYQQLNKISANLAFIADAYMVLYQGALKRQERKSARIGDILSQLYIASCILKKYNKKENKEEDPFLIWAVESCIHKANEAMLDLTNNIESFLLRNLIYRIIFPYGCLNQKTKDKIEHQIAEMMQNENIVRNSFKKFIYITPNKNNYIGMQEVALSKIIKAEKICKKISEKTKEKINIIYLNQIANKYKEIISTEEYDLLIEAEKYRLQTINVDDFDSDELIKKTINDTNKEQKETT